MAENDIPPVDDWVAENYDGLVADENRSETYKSIADAADESGDAQLAAWARAKAAGKNADVTPTEATVEPPTKVVRVARDKKDDEVEVEFPILDIDADEPAKPTKAKATSK